MSPPPAVAACLPLGRVNVADKAVCDIAGGTLVRSANGKGAERARTADLVRVVRVESGTTILASVAGCGVVLAHKTSRVVAR